MQWKHYESEKGMTSHALFRIYKSKDTSKMQLMIVKRGKLLTSSLSRVEGCKHQIKDHTPSATKAAWGGIQSSADTYCLTFGLSLKPMLLKLNVVKSFLQLWYLL